MTKATKKKGAKNKGGRPRTTGGGTFIGFRVFDEQLTRIDAWAKRQNVSLTRQEAMRRLIDAGLVSDGPAKPISKRAAAKATELAAKTIDHLIEDVAPAAPVAEQKKRKRRLLKGPTEFRDIRADLPKPKR